MSTNRTIILRNLTRQMQGIEKKKQIIMIYNWIYFRKIHMYCRWWKWNVRIRTKFTCIKTKSPFIQFNHHVINYFLLIFLENSFFSFLLASFFSYFFWSFLSVFYLSSSFIYLQKSPPIHSNRVHTPFIITFN